MRMYYNNCEIRELEIESLKGAFITDVEVDGDDVIIKALRKEESDLIEREYMISDGLCYVRVLFGKLNAAVSIRLKRVFQST